MLHNNEALWHISLLCVLSNMWQSWVVIKHYSMVHFDYITASEVLRRRTSVKVGAHTCCVNVSSIHEFTQHI